MGGHLALYRKYRGLDFDEIIGQEHITVPLKNAIESNRISHAYLFTGPRGVGKTSVARILAHKLNGLDYRLEENHIDIIEIDAASNRKIDEVRDLREKAYISPVAAKYKVYIIDEVHMLTKEAFNALLKTLEEPPSHVVFILATTELNKLPQTIISRTQRHAFRPISQHDAVKHLVSISEQEELSIERAALELIAEHSDGSFRDAISLLDQVSALAGTSKITYDAVLNMMGFSPDEQVAVLFDKIESGDEQGVLDDLQRIMDEGAQPASLISQMINYIRNDGYSKHLPFIDLLMEAQQANNKEIMLEVACLRYVRNNSNDALQPRVTNEGHAKPKQIVTTESNTSLKKEVTKHEQPLEKQNYKENDNESSGANWNDFIEAVKKKNNAIASILRTSKVVREGDERVINVRFAFHKKKLESAEIAEMLNDVCLTVLGESFTPSIRVDNEPMVPPKNDENDKISASIIETFGGGERIEL